MSFRLAGVSIPLFSVRRLEDPGIGELRDVAAVAAWARRAGFGAVVLLPLGPLGPGERSPYSAWSSFSIDPIHVSLDDVPEAGTAAVPEAAAGRRLDRERVRVRKSAALERAREAFHDLGDGHPRREAFRSFCRRERAWLADDALYGALADELGGDWRRWPAAIRDRDSRALADARRDLERGVGFHEYVQFLADEQWRSAREQCAALGVRILGDLPFLPARASADVWTHRDLFDEEGEVGAPPDDFSESGQSWGLPAPRWDRMRASGWAWLRRRARRMAVLYDGFRIDHLVGYFRTWSLEGGVPSGFRPPDEADQRRQGREILAAMLEECGGRFVFAEDLGSIPDFVRDELDALALPGMRVLRWERSGGGFRDPLDYGECSVATTGTHDTESLGFWWRGLSRDDRRALLRLARVDDAKEAERPRLSARLRWALLGRLFESASRLVLVPVEDVFGWAVRINLPGDVGRRNWTYRLPQPLETLERSPRGRAAATRLGRMARRTKRLPDGGGTALEPLDGMSDAVR